MLATFVIGLREGLEAALIVGIIAAFLRRNGRRLTAMWVGVALAVALSLAVGVGLALVEQALPQAAQEGMEAIIGAVAVFFVTGMIVWMNGHARRMRAELEEQAGDALRDGHALALAIMAFLAVLKEGFETSVFLLATFTASSDTALAALGAVLGVLASVAIGIGIYYGGVKLDLSRFFRITGAFLILVAAGLVVSTLRTAHEAGWILGGQQQVADLSWLVRPGTVPAALLTGVLGIPADPRLIEVIGWVAFLVPVALYVYAPRRLRPRGRAVPVFQAALGGVLALAAVALAVGFAVPASDDLRHATLVNAAGSTVGAATLSGDELTVALDGAAPETRTLDPAAATPGQQAGVDALGWQWSEDTDAAAAPASLTLAELTALNGGSLPIGLNRAQQPGPFTASWHVTLTRGAWVAGGALLQVTETEKAVVTLSGGGLTTPRTVTVGGTDPRSGEPAGWTVADVESRAMHLDAAEAFLDERTLWGVQVPLALALAAGILFAAAIVSGRRLRSVALGVPTTPPEESRLTEPRRDSNAID
ncbi:iron uptake transporter permease EfeU [Microbacterium sp. SORGH_AS_0888]|uniref:iron uptake transporter permease EfeU n=1 Tax=Microbacterium sp. SORGH_AS_0888 TaxID=3041791 RepID=UPI0027806786|nr:iron uptake transporter permease EfeU [Microbacterium sp. SORGH_AS_0888]MDQ1129117.1 high-affinity iron transporter [Microbacterium sp. SORGH_AS_0888]